MFLRCILYFSGKLTHEEKTVEASTGFATVEESDVGKGNINRGQYHYTIISNTC